MRSFGQHCVAGIVPIESRMRELMERSLMTVTALVPHIGYDQAAGIAKAAHMQGVSLRETALQSGALTEPQFDAWVRREKMLGPTRED